MTAEPAHSESGSPLPGLNRLMAKGAAWMGALRLIVRLIGLVSTVILARLLTPEDFGIIAMATSIVAFLELATAFSFDIPLIQKQDADRDLFDSAWTLNALFFTALSILLVLIAHPAAQFYQEPRLVPVIYVLALGFFPRGFENIGFVHFRKNLNFKKDFVLLLSKKLLGFFTAIPLAILFRSYWALVAGIVAGNIIGVILTYLLHPFRPRFSFRAAPELFRFSRWLLLNNVVNYLRTRSPDFIIGRIAGPSALGLFTVAYEMATMPSTEIVAPVNRAVFPGYSKLASNIDELRKSFLDVLALISTVALPAGFGLSAISEPLVGLFLGSNWQPAAPLVATLAIFGAVNAIQSNSGSVYNAIGRPYMITLIGSINIFVLVSASLIAAHRSGPLGVAYAYLLTSIALAPFNFFMICRQIAIPKLKLIGVLVRPMVSALAMFTGLNLLRDHSAISDASNWVQLVILVPTGVVVFSGLMYVSWLLTGRPDSADYRLLRVASEKFPYQRIYRKKS